MGTQSLSIDLLVAGYCMPVQHERPRLRALSIERIDYNGPQLVLRDPLQLAEGYLLIPESLGPLLGSFDGRNSYGELRASLASQLGAVSGPALLDQVLEALDRACLLENETFQAARAAAVTTYRNAPFRTPTMAGHAYPATAPDMHTLFDQLLASNRSDSDSSPCRAIFSPHIDYARGGAIYANLWHAAQATVQNAQLIIVLATDHYSPEPLTLTYQRYATPYGAFETDHLLVDTLAEAIGPTAFQSELYHRHEHSVELVANWIHHMRAGAGCIFIPILCGSFQRYTQQPLDPMKTTSLRHTVAFLQELITTREALVVISGDLAHVGPAFGDTPLNPASETRLLQEDQTLIGQLLAGEADNALASVRQIQDRNKICGLPPGYLALQALGATHGTLHGYQRCPADEHNTSAVTIAGITFA
jgi:MEMO1 family protein